MAEDEPNASATVPGRFSISERAAAFCALALAGAAVVGLVIALISGKAGNRLATIALILAAVAFLLQIAFFVFQIWLAQEQDRRTRATYRETAELLTRIETTSSDTVDVIKDQFRFVLEHALAPQSSSGLAAVEADDDIEDDLEDDDEIAADGGDTPVRDEAGVSADGAESVNPPPATAPEVERGLQRAVAQLDALQRQVRDLTASRDVLGEWERISNPGAARRADRAAKARSVIERIKQLEPQASVTEERREGAHGERIRLLVHAPTPLRGDQVSLISRLARGSGIELEIVTPVPAQDGDGSPPANRIRQDLVGVRVATLGSGQTPPSDSGWAVRNDGAVFQDGTQVGTDADVRTGASGRSGLPRDYARIEYTPVDR
jgi:hypothetical protein